MDRLIEKIMEKKSPIAVGLDTRLETVPDFLIRKHRTKDSLDFHGAAQAILEFNKGIIDGIVDLVPAVKLQLACYELYGVEGMKAFCDTVRYAKQKGLIVIGDGKRNDIGSTAKAYSVAYLGKTPLPGKEERAFETDMMTVNPYLGFDGVEPFIEDCRTWDKDIFVLVRTSNPSSVDFQDLVSGNQRIYEAVADKVNDWGRDLTGDYGFSRVGAVVGATWPDQAVALRRRMPHTFFLVPGYGAQGGGADDVLGCFDQRGLGALINASRSILCAYKGKSGEVHPEGKNFVEVAREETIRMKKDIENALLQNGTRPW